MNRWRLILVGAAGAVLGLLALFLSGLLDVSASSGQSGLSRWLFHTAVRQSVTLRSIGIAVPPLDDDGMVRRGAGHYDLVCATCHGAPGRAPAAFARDLVPPPPPLVDQMENWRPPARLFWTVKHGVRHSAMPAWPDQLRDDEVWDMVAFLQRLPELSPEAYAEASGRDEGALCARCHGVDGGGDGAHPRLDIQSPAYLAGALRAFRDGARRSGTMRTVVGGMGDAALAELAARYGQGPFAPAAPAGDGPGAALALRGDPDRKIPACDSCHGANARPDYPRLAGQDADYIIRQLRLFATLGADRGGPHAAVMAAAARGLSPEDMAAVAAWYAAR